MQIAVVILSCVIIVVLGILIAVISTIHKEKKKNKVAQEICEKLKQEISKQLSENSLLQAQIEKEKIVFTAKEMEEVQNAKEELKRVQSQIALEQEKQNKELLLSTNAWEEMQEKKRELKEQIAQLVQEKERASNDLMTAKQTLETKQAEIRNVESFVKNSFGDEMPCLDFSAYFEEKGLSVVLKLLDDCVVMAPQLKSDIRKIEWSLCYMPYKKVFIKELSKSGIYALEVKREFEPQVLEELGLVRVNEVNPLVYIGQATNIYDRWTMHIKKMLGVESAGGEKLYKFAPYIFNWRVLEWCDSSKLNERESYWIECFSSKDTGLNTKGGNKN